MKILLTTHRRDQSAIQGISQNISTVIVFHTVIHILGIFCIFTLHFGSNKLAMAGPRNFPAYPWTLALVIAVLLFLWSVLQSLILPRTKLALVMLVTILSTSSAGTIVYTFTCRSIMIRATPRQTVELHPDTFIIDVDKRGWLSLHETMLSLEQARKIIEARYQGMGEYPAIICGDRRTKYRDIRKFIDIFMNTGITDIAIADQKTPEYFRVNIADYIASEARGTCQTDQTYNVTVSLYYGGEDERFGRILNGKKATAEQLKDHVLKAAAHDSGISVLIKNTATARHGNLLETVQIMNEAGIENIFISSI